MSDLTLDLILRRKGKIIAEAITGAHPSALSDEQLRELMVPALDEAVNILGLTGTISLQEWMED